MKKIIIMALMTLSSTLTFAQQNSNDEQAIHSIFSTLETGWNNKSGDTFSSVFADVHDYIVINGMYFPNWTKAGNRAAHQGLFDGIYKNRDIKIVVDKINFLTSDLAQVTVLAASFEKGGALPDDPNAIMTILTERKNNEWKIISFHNHGFDAAELQQQNHIPLQVMYAAWYKNITGKK